MRTDTPAFSAKNAELTKEPRHVIALSFDDDNTIVRHVTSHDDCALPPGATAVARVLENTSVTSQTLNPDTANAQIGAMTFSAVDRLNAMTDTLGGQLALGRSTRRQRVQLYEGYKGLAWDDYTLAQTQLVDRDIEFDGGVYTFGCADVQREMRKDIFDLAKTTLAQSVAIGDTTVNVYDTSAFELVAHGTSYSDAPSATVGYVKIEQEVIRYTGKTATTFTGCTRGALNTREAEHAVDPTTDPDRRTAVAEYIYLEMPALKLMYALLTGILHGQGGATLPATWHLGISTAYVRLADFTSKPDLWDTSDDEKGLPVRFEDRKKTDGKKFLEEQVAFLSGVFMPIYADGAVGCRRMANILAGAAYVALLDDTNVVSHGGLKYDLKSLHNVLRILWNWEPARGEHTRPTVLVDAGSIITHKEGELLTRKFDGLHGSRHSSAIIAQLFDFVRDRYTGPPLRIDVRVVPPLNGIEVGDVVRLKLDDVQDIAANGPLDRSFEVQNVAIDWNTGEVNLKLFASSQAPGAIAPTGDAAVLSDAWWTSEGTALSTVLTITGSNPGHVTASGTLTGNAVMTAAGAIYYYVGDLVIDPGVTVTLAQNVQLRVKGQLTNNGRIAGVGAGLAGSAGQAVNGAESPGTAGFIGVTEAGGGLYVAGKGDTESWRGVQTVGANAVAPALLLAWDGSTLSGLPTDLRGSSGGGGHFSWMDGYSQGASGGAGGAGGAGFLLICRGFSQGAAGNVDLSGAPGSAGGWVNPSGELTVYGGGGAGGAPGAFYVLLDGALTTATDLGAESFVALYGSTPMSPGRVTTPTERIFSGAASSYYVGTGDGTLFEVPSLSGARGGSRVQYVPGNPSAVADPSAVTLAQPTSLGLSSGTSELLVQSDGTIVVRIKLEWTPTPDSRVAGYDIQSKLSSAPATDWQDSPPALGQSTAKAWIVGVKDGVNYDVRIRAAGRNREVSEWTTITNYPVIGKTAPPANVGALAFTDPILSWPKVADLDLRGYVVRYQPGASTDWASATPAHVEGFLTENQLDVIDIVGTQVTFLVRAIDTSGNLSTSVSSSYVDLRPPQVNTFLVSRQPDGTREYTWTLTSPPDDLDGFRIRYYLGSTSDWSAMTALHNGLLQASPFESNQLAAGTWTLAIKAVDWAGNESETAKFITTTIGDPRIAGSIEDVKEEPDWTGTKTSCHVDGGTGWLVADGTLAWSGLPATWAGWTVWNQTPVGSIVYQRNLDVGAITTFVPLVTATADGSQTIEEQHSNDDFSYTGWAAVGPQVTARYIRIRITVAGSYPKIKTMRTVLSATPLTEIIEDLDTSTLTGAYDLGVGDVRLPIVGSYAVIKGVALTLQNVGAGWTWELIDKNTTTGPRVKIYNGAGALADATIDADIQGI